MSKPYDFVAHDNSFTGPPTWTIFHREMMNAEASFAYQFIERWGMVAGLPDGEDSAGRQKLRVMTPVELVERATMTVKHFHETIERLGWIQEIPSPEAAEEAVEKLREDRQANRKKGDS